MRRFMSRSGCGITWCYKEGLMNCHWDLVLYEWVIREKNLTLLLNTHMHRVKMKDKKDDCIDHGDSTGDGENV